MAANPRAVIGDNLPPEPTPLEAFSISIADLIMTAQGFLDGEPITTKALADEVGRLKGMCADTARDAEKQRKLDKQPYLDVGAAIDAAWKPLIAKCDLAKSVAQKALGPWLALEQARIDAEAADARRIADAARIAAQEALAEANEADLVAREEAEALLKSANKADKAANRADGVRASVAGTGRSIGLRTVWSAAITDRRAAMNHYLKTHPDSFVAIIQELADHEARNGPRSAPGVSFTSEQVAV